LNDFDYDVMQKKRLARNAQYRTGKRGGRTCRMTTDRLTDKQWKEMNGEVMSYSLNEPMSWRDFKSASIHIQSNYLENLITKYKVNASSLAQMFGVTSTTVRNFIESNQIGVSFRVGCSMTTNEREAWENFLGNIDAQQPEPEQVNNDCVHSAREVKTLMNRFSLSFSGVIDGATIANSIMSIAGAGTIGNIEIICSLDNTVLETA
jgi:plasmid maintenance system antidote protein VapI